VRDNVVRRATTGRSVKYEECTFWRAGMKRRGSPFRAGHFSGLFSQFFIARRPHNRARSRLNPYTMSFQHLSFKSLVDGLHPSDRAPKRPLELLPTRPPRTRNRGLLTAGVDWARPHILISFAVGSPMFLFAPFDAE